MFDLFDVEGKGFLSHDDILAVSEELGQQLSEKDAMEIHSKCNTRGDGRLTFDEFYTVYCKKTFKLSI